MLRESPAHRTQIDWRLRLSAAGYVACTASVKVLSVSAGTACAKSKKAVRNKKRILRNKVCLLDHRSILLRTILILIRVSSDN